MCNGISSWVLICLNLMTSDAEYFLCICCVYIFSLFWGGGGDIFKFFYWVLKVLYTFWVQVTYMWLANSFSFYVPCLLFLLKASFKEKFLILSTSSLYIFFFNGSCFWCHLMVSFLWKLCLMLTHKVFFMFSSRIFIVLRSTFN